MNKKFHAHTFRGAAVFPVTIFLLALTLNACGAKPAEGTSAEQNAAATSPTSKPESNVYDWNGMPLYMNAPWPETPPEVKIYLAQDEVRASVEDVQRLAKQFGMHGEIYETPGEFYETTDYLVMDGNRQLRVRSDRYFTYYPDAVRRAANLPTIENPDAEALIHEFMQAHGFNFEYKFEHPQFGQYLAIPLTPDGFALEYMPFSRSGLAFFFDENGIAFVSASLMKYDEATTADIITPEQALQRFTDANSNYYGWTVSDSYNPDPGQPAKKMWLRPPSLEQKVAYIGFLQVIGKSITDAAPLITLDGYTVTGNIEGISETNMSGYVEATGMLHDTDGVKTFEIESWKIYEDIPFHHGSIQREGEQVIVNTTEGKKLILPDFPSELSLPAEEITIEGAARNGVLDWKRMANYAFDGGGGGGGGGGSGYYKLNLTGAPVPFVTPTPVPSPTLTPLEASLPKPVEGLRGFVQITIFQTPDGAQSASYLFFPQEADYLGSYFYLSSEGDALKDLQNYNNRPVDVWGVINLNEYGVFDIKVERFEIPYPDLQIQLFKGTQKLATIEGQAVTLFTTEDNHTYVQLREDTALEANLMGPEGDQVILEALIIPNETFGGYPVLRSIFGGPALNPVTGKPNEYSITADKPEILPQQALPVLPTSASIEKVDLIYYTPDYRHSIPPPNSEPPYVQPMWRFYGHYDNGGEFEIFVQALKEEFLLPEIQPLY